MLSTPTFIDLDPKVLVRVHRFMLKLKNAEYYNTRPVYCTYEAGNQPLRAMLKLDAVRFLFDC